MDKKTVYAIAVVAILVVAAVGAFFLMNNSGKDIGSPTEMDSAELKVYGNINGDRYLNDKDADLIQKLIDDGKTAVEYPLADANQDKVLDKGDVELVKKVAKGESATIWHINYHDMDADGDMDQVLVSTQFPITSCIISGSANVSLGLFTIGVVDEVKGAAYSSSSLDPALYGDSYLDTEKVEKVGTSATTIKIEDGKVGSSDIIAKEHVTALISDWNRSYIKNEADFEKIGIDVIRVSSASTDKEVMTHSTMLLGLLFQKVDRAESYLDLNLEILGYVSDAIEGKDAPLVVVSSSDGAISSGNSDYTRFAEVAGGKFALDKVDFGGSASIKVVDHPEIYTNEFNFIIHLRTAVNYSQSEDKIQENYEKYCDGFKDWKYAETGQYMVSGSIAASLRCAYIAVALHSDAIDMDKVNAYHQKMVDEFFNGLEFDIASMSFFVAPTTA